MLVANKILGANNMLAINKMGGIKSDKEWIEKSQKLENCLSSQP